MEIRKIVFHKGEKTGYDVIVGDGILKDTGAILASLYAPRRVVIVSDDNISPLYEGTLVSSLAAAGFDVVSHTVPSGEESKSPSSLTDIWSTLAEHGFCRDDCIVALGGGVICDLCAFAGATYMRGIGTLLIPTSLLAMTDAAIGGKCGIDLPCGKNLAGVIRRPLAVICDVSVLATLPQKELSSGMAEVVKYAFACRPALADMLDTKGPIADVILECIDIKRTYVEADEYDTGARRVLNFGHTVGHAIEECSSYTVPHGFAVAAGCAIVTRAAVRRGLCPARMSVRLETTLVRYGLPVGTSYSADAIAAAAVTDKKRGCDGYVLMVPYGMGDIRPISFDTAELYDFIAEGIV